jgi:hypothetical protein
MPNVTHLHLLSHLVDNSEDENSESIVGLVQSSAENIVRLLQFASGGNVLFDPHTVTDTARETVQFISE